MDVLKSTFVDGFVRMCNDGFMQGWHERNGGNLSYRIKTEDIVMVKDSLTFDGEWQDIGTTVPDLAGEFFLVTGSGKFFRNVMLAPESNITIIEICSKGKSYRICWGLGDSGRPTSELPITSNES